MLFFFSKGNAQIRPDTSRHYHLKKTTTHIKIDGQLDDHAWQTAEKQSGFWQQYPYDTAAARSNTEVMMAYNEQGIYIAAICYDSFPGNFVVTSLKRDFEYDANDAFGVYIDPFNDKINGFYFGVNPYGAQSEGLLQNGGGYGTTNNWDNKWFSAVSRHPGYWIAEIRIPYKTLRYKEGMAEWGINFSRNCQKINENSSWSFIPRNFTSANLAYTGKLIWDAPPPKAGLNISLIPYAITRFTQDYTAGTKGLQTVDAGFDAKVSVTASLNLDLTVNPDFSQVDVDQQVTNLTRFNLFFPERRQFFLENSDLFANQGFSQIRPFFSRRIGLKSGRNIPILGGARLSGKLNKDWRIGVMNVQTGAYNKDGITANPENFTVATVQRQVWARSNISAIVVNKENMPGPDSSANAYNRVAGFDYYHASNDNKWQGKVFFHHSFSPYQPKNAFTHASWLLYSTPNWLVMWNHEYVNSNYRAETGFIRRQNVYDGARDLEVPMTFWRLEPEVGHNFYPKNSPVYKVNVGVYADIYADSAYKTNDALMNNYAVVTFLNRAECWMEYKLYHTYLYFPIDITGTGKTPLPVGGYNYRTIGGGYSSNSRKLFNWQAYFVSGTFFNGTSYSYGGSMGYRVQPWGNFSLTYRTDEIKLPAPYGYTNLTLIGPRLEFTFTRSLFFTTFIQYNTQADNVNLNARLQWRFAPMSDLFIVYGDNYGPYDRRYVPGFKVRDKGVVLKLVYWLGV